MEITICILATGALCIACFLIGFKCGRHEEIKVPEMTVVNPLTAYRNRAEKEHAKKEMEKLDKIMSNLDRYDGTEMGQRDID